MIWIIQWLEWQMITRWPSLLIIVAIFMGHYWHTIAHHSASGLMLAGFVGVCAWVVFCAMKYGYAVG